MRSPWPIVALLLLFLGGLLTLAVRLPRAGQAVLVPIRPPLTRPAPAEALLIAPDRADPPAGDDDDRLPQLGDRATALRATLADDAGNIGAALAPTQLLHILAQRDRLVRDRYEGRWYVQLETALAERAAP
jgi:hypothetical protein